MTKIERLRTMFGRPRIPVEDDDPVWVCVSCGYECDPDARGLADNCPNCGIEIEDEPE